MLGTVDWVRARRVIVSLWQRPRGQEPPGNERTAGLEPRGEPRTAALAKLCRSAKPVRSGLGPSGPTRGDRYRRRRPWLPLHHLPHTAAGGIKGDRSGATRRTDRAACNSPARSSYGLTPLVAANPEQPRGAACRLTVTTCGMALLRMSRGPIATTPKAPCTLRCQAEGKNLKPRINADERSAAQARWFDHRWRTASRCSRPRYGDGASEQ